MPAEEPSPDNKFDMQQLQETEWPRLLGARQATSDTPKCAARHSDPPQIPKSAKGGGPLPPETDWCATHFDCCPWAHEIEQECRTREAAPCTGEQLARTRRDFSCGASSHRLPRPHSATPCGCKDAVPPPGTETPGIPGRYVPGWGGASISPSGGGPRWRSDLPLDRLEAASRPPRGRFEGIRGSLEAISGAFW